MIDPINASAGYGLVRSGAMSRRLVLIHRMSNSESTSPAVIPWLQATKLTKTMLAITRFFIIFAQELIMRIGLTFTTLKMAIQPSQIQITLFYRFLLQSITLTDGSKAQLTLTLIIGYMLLLVLK